MSQHDSPKVSIEKLDPTNYFTWSFKVLRYLEGKDLDSALTAVPPTPPGEDADEVELAAFDLKMNSYVKNNKKVRSILSTVISNEVLPMVMPLESCKDIWDVLKVRLCQSDFYNKYALRLKLYNEKMENESVHSYVSRIRALVLKLRFIGCTVDEQEESVCLLNGLPPEYGSLVQLICNGSENLTLDAIVGRILAHQSQSSVSSQHQAMRAEYRRPPRNATPYDRDRDFPPTSSDLFCNYCKKRGHTKDKCKRRKQRPKNTASLARVSMPRPGARSSLPSDETLFHVGTSQQLSGVGLTRWIADSGASKHMSSSFNELVDYAPFETPRNVFLADNSSLDILGSGTVHLVIGGVPLTLKNVLYVPSLSEKLISISQLTSSGVVCTFSDCKLMMTTPRGNICVSPSMGIFPIIPDRIGAMLSSEIQHRRMGHLGHTSLTRLFPGTSQIKDCRICAISNQKRRKFKHRSSVRASRAGQIIHSDVCGPIKPVSVGGARYIVSFIDDFTRYSECYPVRYKSQVLEKFKLFCATSVTQTGLPILTLVSDNGGEYSNRDFSEFCASKGVIQNFTVPHSPELNGVAERWNLTIWTKARSIMAEANAPGELWAEAVHYANLLRNASPTSITGEIPFEKWFNRPFKHEHLRVWGCDAFTKLEHRLDKHSPRAKLLTFIGCNREMTGYRLLDLETKQVLVRRNVEFHEESFSMIKSPFSKEVSLPMDFTADHIDSDPVTPIPLPIVQETPVPVTPPQVALAPIPTIAPFPVQEEILDDPGFITPLEEQPDESVTASPPLKRHRPEPGFYRRIQRGYSANDDFLDSDPITIDDVQMSPFKDDWVEAINSEIQSLVETKTFEICDLPEGRNAVGARWIFKSKIRSDGTIERRKARLVAQGFLQQEGIDFNETFAPVVRFDTVRTCLSVAAAKNLNVLQMDVVTAFLNGRLDEEIYLRVPSGVPSTYGKIWRLRRSLYGLKQSPRQWGIRLSEFLSSIGYRRSENDPCLWIDSDKETWILVYVDDLVLIGPHLPTLHVLQKKLTDSFKMKDLGVLNYFLGVSVTFSPAGIRLSQKRYAEEILTRFNMNSCRPVAMPMDPGLFSLMSSDATELISVRPYQQAIGALLYLVTMTRPDLAFAASALSRFLAKPRKVHQRALEHVFRYLKGTTDHSILFKSSLRSPALKAFSDADWAGCSTTRRSTSGYLLLFGNSPICWRSQRQPCVALSTMEAEYIAACSAAQEIVWMRRLLTELTVPPLGPTVLFADNQSCISFTHEPKFHRNTKHIQLRFHYLREQVESKEMVLVFVQSDKQLADPFTKPLPAQGHARAFRQLFQDC